MKSLALLLAFSFNALAGYVTVTGILRDASGNRVPAARVDITPNSQFTCSNGDNIYQGVSKQTVNGLLTVNLCANDTATPVNTSYSVRIAPQGGVVSNETWIVNSSPNPAALSDVRTSPTPIPSFTVNISQLRPFGTANQCLAMNGSATAIVWSSSCGGGNPAGSNGDLQRNNSGSFGAANINQQSDGTLLASKAIAGAASSTPTFNGGGTTTCDLSASNICTVNMTGNTTLAVSNPHGAVQFILNSCQDATGSRVYTAFPATFKGAVQPASTLSTCTLQLFTYDGTNYQGGWNNCPLCDSGVLIGAISGGGSNLISGAAGATNALNPIPNVSGTFVLGNTFAALTDAASVTWAIGGVTSDNKTLTFTVHSGSRTLNITNPVSGGSYVLWLKQDSTGGEGLILGTGCTWKVSGGGSGAITPSTGANAVDVLAFTYDGTNCYANFAKNFN